MEGGREGESRRKAWVGLSDLEERREGRLQRGKIKGQMEVEVEGRGGEKMKSRGKQEKADV